MTAAALSLNAVDAASPADRASAIAFVNTHYPSPFPLDESSLVSGKIRLYWAADTTGARVGITGYMAKTPFLAESVKSVLDPAHRGRGLGAALSLAIEDEVRRAGFKKIMSTIYVDNLSMLFIKLKSGYLVEGTHFDHEKPGLHEYSLGKKL